MNRRGGSTPSVLYAIADAEALAPRSLAEGAVAMAEAGIATIQLRAKTLDDATLFREAEACVRRLEGWAGSLWIDDRADLALLLGFDGVHVGQRDLPAGAAKRILPPGALVGVSTHDEAQLAAAGADPAADWLAFGPVFATRSKREPDAVVGLEGLRHVAGRSALQKPLIAIGGIGAENLREVLDTGADSAAVLSAVCTGDVAVNCRRLLAALAA